MRILVLCALALLACGEPSPAARSGAPLQSPEACESLNAAYVAAASEARRCDPRASDPCGGQALENLQSQCVLFVPSQRVPALEVLVAEYRAAGCALGTPAPCPLREGPACEQDVTGTFVCVARGPGSAP